MCSCQTRPSPSSAKAPLRIVCIGDSVIQGRGDRNLSGKPRSPVGDDARALGLRAEYAKIAADLNRPDAPPADWQWDPAAADADTVDGSHPNKQDDQKIARDFFEATFPLLSPRPLLP